MGATGTYSVSPYVDVVTLTDRSQSGFTFNLEDIRFVIGAQTRF